MWYECLKVTLRNPESCRTHGPKREIFPSDEGSCSRATRSLGGSFSRLPVWPLALGSRGRGKSGVLKPSVANYSLSEVQLQVPALFSGSKALLDKTQKAWRKSP